MAAGTGLAGWHGGIADSYRNSSDYLQLIGGQFATHPAKAAPGELAGERPTTSCRYTVDIVTDLGPTHPIIAGIDDFELTTEQYWVLHDDLNDVLATTTHPARDVAPLAPAGHVARRSGRGSGAQGRVFVSTPGHSLEVLERPERSHHHREGHAVGDAARASASSGSGDIAGAYLATLERQPAVRLAAVADLDAARAAAVAAEPGARALTVDELLADPEVDTVLNLTIPAAHAEIALRAIAARQGRLRREAARGHDGGCARDRRCRGRAAGVRVGCAPDTVLGTGMQTARAGDRRRRDRRADRGDRDAW